MFILCCLTSQISELEGLLSERNHQLTSLQSELAFTRSQAHSVRAGVTQSAAHAAMLDAELDATRAQLADVRSRLEADDLAVQQEMESQEALVQEYKVGLTVWPQ